MKISRETEIPFYTYIVKSVKEIGRTRWNLCFGHHVEGFDYHQALENSGLTQFSFYYVCVACASGPIAIAPVFTGDLDLLIGADGFLVKLIAYLRKRYPRILISKTLFCGSPFGEQGVVGVHPSARDTNSKIILILAEAIQDLGSRLGASHFLFKDFPESSSGCLHKLNKVGYFKGAGFPNIRLNLPFATAQDYLASLSYGRRKEIKRKLRKTNANSPISVVETRAIETYIDRVYELYLQTFNAGTVKFELLTKAFFLEIAAQLKEQCVYFLYFCETKLICFNLCLIEADGLIDKFIGFDYTISQEKNLYIYTWYYNVCWCINHKLSYYQVGQTDHAIKIALGGKILPLYYWSFHQNRIYHTVMRMAANLLGPKT